MAVSLKRSVTGSAMAVGALACALAAQAQGFKPPPAPSTGPPAHDYVSDTQLAQLFTAFCIKAFPDAAAVDAALKVHSQAQLTPEQAMPYLPDGSGKGWLVRTPDSLFALTVEDAPHQTCALQQMTPEGVRDVAGLVAAIKAHVEPSKGKIVVAAPDKATSADGLDVRYWGYGVLSSDDVPVEQFGVYVSDYKGKAPAPWTPYAGKGSGVTVKFTRTLLAG